jgi:hypothetical protein
LRRYTCSNSSSSQFGGRPRDRALTATGRSRMVLTWVLASVLMSLVAILAYGCDMARPRRSKFRDVNPEQNRSVAILERSGLGASVRGGVFGRAELAFERVEEVEQANALPCSVPLPDGGVS